MFVNQNGEERKLETTGYSLEFESRHTGVFLTKYLDFFYFATAFK